MGDEQVTILGGRGMLGSALALACRDKYDLKVLDLPDFDITNRRQLEEVVRSSLVIVNCAAYTDVDGAEANVDLAYRVNGEAVGRLGDFAKAAGVWVLHISTDFVFDGRLDRPYVEADPPNPINTYGKSKLAGERLLVESGCRPCIMRVQWTYGPHGKNFVTKIAGLARSKRQLLAKRPEGVFHFASAGYVSRYEMARFICEKLKMEVEVLPCSSSEFVTPAKRPLNSRFECGKIKSLLGERIERWEEPLENFLRQL